MKTAELFGEGQRVTTADLFPERETVKTADILRDLDQREADFQDVVSSHTVDLPPGSEQKDSTPWKVKHPDAYVNAYATFGVAKDFVPFLKYVDPEEREQFSKLTQQGKTRDVLLETLNAALLGRAKPIGQFAGKVGGALLERFMPKTFKVLNRPLGQAAAREIEDVANKKITTQQIIDKTAQPAESDVPVLGKPGEMPKNRVMRVQEEEEILATTRRAIDEGLLTDEDALLLSDDKQRLMYNIATTIVRKPEAFMDILQRYGMTPQEYADELVKAGSLGGKFLNRLSQFKKEFNALVEANPELGAMVERVSAKRPSLWETFKTWYKKIDNPRRALMTSQPTTTVRNIESQAMRYTLDTFDQMLQGMMNTARGESPRDAFAGFLENFHAMMRRTTEQGRVRVEQILDKYPAEASDLLSAPIQDVTIGGKLSRFVTTLNRWQEYFFRKTAFDAKVTSLCKKAGLNPTTDPIPQNILNDAVAHALELTYAKAPSSGPGKALMRMYKEVPFLTTVNPFPRFWLNSVRFLWDFNPTGFLSAASHVAQKNAGKAVKSASRATMGSMMLAYAYGIRNDPEMAGEKWYQVRAGKDPDTGNDRVINTLAFAPFTQYLFLAEAMSHPEKITPKDWTQGMLAINRIAGTGLVLLDALTADNVETIKKKVSRFVGEYMGGFTVPGKAVEDLMAEAGVPGEEFVRSSRENPLVGPALSNIPIADQALPVAQRLTRDEPYKRTHGIERQFMGITYQDKTELEGEMDRLRLRGLYPQTGDATLDRKITDIINGPIEEYGGRLVASPEYGGMDDDQKAEHIRALIGKIRSAGKDSVIVRHMENRIMSMSGDDRVDYMRDMVQKGRVDKQNLGLFFTRNQNLFTQKELRRIFKQYEQ